MKKILNQLKFISKIFFDLYINWLCALSIWPYSIRKQLYKLYGIKTNTKYIEPGQFFEGINVKNIKIGKSTSINYKCFFSCNAPIEIGNYCSISFGVTFCTSSHEKGDKFKRAGKLCNSPIKIGNGCWIGANATILPGVVIGDGCIIAAGATIIKNCDPNGLYAGVPARRIKDLE